MLKAFKSGLGEVQAYTVVTGMIYMVYYEFHRPLELEKRYSPYWPSLITHTRGKAAQLSIGPTGDHYF